MLAAVNVGPGWLGLAAERVAIAYIHCLTGVQ